MATGILTQSDAIIDKLAGDQVMALFVPGFAGKDAYIEKMVAAAEGLLIGVGCGGETTAWLPVGVGLDTGVCYVGNVGSGEVKDFTALGDPVNTAARLQSHAKPGQIVMSERVYEFARDSYPDAPSVELDLKGKSEPVTTRIIDLNARIAP